MTPNFELRARAKAALGGKIFGNVWMLALAACLIVSAILGACGSIPYVGGIGTLLLLGVLNYGLAKVFLKNARTGAAPDIADLFTGFKEDFGGLFLLNLMIEIKTVLWSLLFVFPGIIKTYAWRMSYKIKVDNPELDWRECMARSAAMMVGRKWKLFCLDLSFIGWYIVGALCFGIGTLWVAPYHTAAVNQFYQDIISTPVEMPFQ